MIRTFNALQRSRRGFTLIEFTVVFILMAIIASIVLPQFTGVSDGATDTSARSHVEGVISIASAIYAGTTWLPTSTAVVASEDPDMTIVGGGTPSTAPDIASVATSTNGTVYGVAVLGAGQCWMEAWNTDDTVPPLNPYVYASESTSVAGFTCSGSFALQILNCTQSEADSGASWNSPLICDLSNLS
jgi:prepilin-type N-terminal cleavage/methylation domain-containing protein